MIRLTVGQLRQATFGAIASLLALSTVATAQDSTVVFGRVLDAESMGPISGAFVHLSGSNRAAITDSLGRFGLQIDSAPLFVLVIEHLGYHTLEWTVSHAKPAPIDLYLSPDPIELEALAVLSEGFAHRERGPYGVAQILDREELVNAPDGTAYDLILRFIPRAQKCDAYSEALCLPGRDRLGERRLVSVCLDDIRVQSRLMETALAGVDPRSLYYVEIYSREGEVRLFSPVHMKRLIEGGGSLRPVTFGCRDDPPGGELRWPPWFRTVP